MKPRALNVFFTFNFLYLVKAENFRTRFEKSFNESCLKYDFVYTFWKNLENPSNRFIVMVMSEYGVNHGGLGDRLGGLVTATLNSIRFNRTLLLHSVDDFGNLFRPYRDPRKTEIDFDNDNSNLDNKFTYNNWTSWTAYDPSLANNDATELDLWFCVNDSKNAAKCGMDYGDANQPIIKYRTNRAYLCKWMNNAEVPVYNDLVSMGIKPEDDMMEVAGCALRLAMWPTANMWRELEALIYADVYAKANISPAAGLLSQQSSSVLPDAESILKPESQLQTQSKNNRRMHTEHEHQHQHHHEGPEGFIVSAHYRCGDVSFVHKNEGYDSQCRYHPDESFDHGMTPYLLEVGTPVELARCVSEILVNHTRDAPPMTGFTRLGRRRRLLRQYSNNMRGLNRGSLEVGGNAAVIFPLLYVASDNQGSADQIVEEAKYDHSYVASSSCHVELDKSAACFLHTVTHWMVMVMSDAIVTQASSDVPVSGFSRFAAIYGLRGDTIKTAQRCGNSLTRHEQAKLQIGNWWCR